MKLAPYMVMTLVAAAAVAIACYLVPLSGVAIYDSNLQVFRDKLTEDEAAGIIKASSGLLSLQVLLLAMTNLMWVVGVGVALWRSRGMVKRGHHS